MAQLCGFVGNPYLNRYSRIRYGCLPQHQSLLFFLPLAQQAALLKDDQLGVVEERVDGIEQIEKVERPNPRPVDICLTNSLT